MILTCNDCSARAVATNGLTLKCSAIPDQFVVITCSLPAACLGMYLCYNAFDRTSTAEACLHRIMDLPTPLGAEAIEIVRAKDETSRHLR